ncbi:MAG: nucleotidyltransferase domain-containing protein, partial [Bacteroidales bacterium]|nr:nucleotidyltransferase domain-containing protein [Bacteroidales bacterium]
MFVPKKVYIFTTVIKTNLMGMASGCKIKKKRSVNSITKIIAGYFKNQPVVKAWLFGSFARGE